MAVVAMQATRAAPAQVNSLDANRDAVLKSLASNSKDSIRSALAQVRRADEDDVDLKIQESVARLLGHQEPEVAAAAAAVLGGLGGAGTRYVEYLVPLLRHPSPRCRTAAAEALGRLGKPAKRDASRAVASALKDNEVGVRLAAVLALGSMEAKDQAQAICAVLHDPSADVRSAAVETLGLLAAMSLEAESVFAPKARLELFVDFLANPQTRIAALAALAHLGDKAPGGAVDAAVGALVDQDPLVRQAAVAAVGAMAEAAAASPEAVSRLKDLLASEAVGTRAAAAHALGAMAEPCLQLADRLVELLADGSADESGIALRMGGGARRLPPQLRLPRCAALSSLGRTGNPVFSSNIANFLFDTNWEVRVTSAEALAALGQGARNDVSSLLGLLDDDAFPVRVAACRALGVLKDAEALPRLVEAFEDRTPSVRAAALSAVAELAEFAEDSGHDVFKLLNDAVPSVRAAAARCLSSLGESAQHYASAVGPMLYDDEPEVRCAVLEALPRMGAPGASFKEEAAERLDDPVKSVRQAAGEALDKMGSATFLALKDSGRGLARLPGPPRPVPEGAFDGLGPHFGGIQQRKAELQLSGKWIDGVL